MTKLSLLPMIRCKDNRVEYFVYHRVGSKPPSRAFASWTGYKKAGPLLFSTEHRGMADGKPLHVFITDVAVKLTGSDTWTKAYLEKSVIIEQLAY